MNKQMRAVFTILDYSRYEEAAEMFENEGVPVRFAMHGHGAADSDILDYLGFGENKKSIMISLLTAARADKVIVTAAKKLQLDKPGKGIVFSVPISSMTVFLSGLLDLDEQKHSTEADKESEIEMSYQYSHELIVTIITKGFFPEVKTAANQAGARGGTLIHALGLGGEEAQKFLGISIQPEKDIILIVVNREDRNKVMKAIADAAGINTQGKGIIFSMPVDAAFGLSESNIIDEIYKKPDEIE